MVDSKKGRPRPLRPVAVQLDGLDAPNGQPQWFPAFTTGELWNGFATPYFEKHVADNIAKAFTNKGGVKAWYDAKKDAFLFEDDEGLEEFAAVSIGGRKLYPIGNSYWAWSSNDSEN